MDLLRKIFVLFVTLSFFVCAASVQAGTCGSADDGEGKTHKTGAGPEWTADSASYEDVSYCIKCAAEGDTINVPADSATWDERLTITEAITLKGAGAGNTTITSNYEAPSTTMASDNFLIVYQPASPSGTLFRITGFTFDMDNKCSALKLYNPSITPETNVRIHHNDFLNSYRPPNARMILIMGTVYGVIDNNTISTDGSDVLDSYGHNADSWNNLSFSYGSAENIYIEDNIFTVDNSPHMGGLGGRYCVRYNTYISSKGLHPFCDMHGNMGEGGNYSTMGAEVYGNRITGPSGQSIGVIDQRGGKAMVWDNVVYTSSAYAKVREEVWDDYNPTINEQPQHVSDSYYWDNWKNETDFITFYTGNICGTTVVSSTPNCSDKVHGYSLNEDDEWFRHKADFDGSSGIGTGTYAEMTAISHTTIGVGFWCTDRGGNWHKTNETENDGCLYTWNGNSWEVKYVPYAYPHPLRKPQPPDPRIP